MRQVHITCFKCGKKGHYLNECPEKDQNKDKGDGKTEEKEVQTRVQMLLVACESGDLDNENAGFFFHQISICKPHMDYRSALLSMPAWNMMPKDHRSDGGRATGSI